MKKAKIKKELQEIKEKVELDGLKQGKVETPVITYKKVFDLDSNKKQKQFFEDVIDAIEGRSKKRFFFYGGAIRGGKTSICLFILHYLSCKYPGFVSYVIRGTTPDLDSVRASFKKLFENSQFIRKIPSDGTKTNIWVQYKNGSIIKFQAENFQNDKDLDRFKGLEANVIMLEQMEELQHATFLKAIERMGSWYKVENAPPCIGLILGNFNPTFNWVKTEIYDKYRDGKLSDKYYYLSALPTDNPHVRDDQFDQWKEMDSLQYRRMVQGDWDAMSPNGRFMYNFDRAKHMGKCNYNLNHILYLSFDFNINPMTCLAIQYYNDKIYVIAEFLEPNIGIQEFCRILKTKIPTNIPILIGGDPTGYHRDGRAGNNTSYYSEILRIMELSNHSLRVHKGRAPRHEESWVICNKIFEIFPSITVDSECTKLINDLENVKFSELHGMERMKYSKIVEEGGQRITQGHLMDCLRYFFHENLGKYTKVITKNS